MSALKEGLEKTSWEKPPRDEWQSVTYGKSNVLGSARKSGRLRWIMLFEEYVRDEVVSRVFFWWTHRFLPFRARVPSRAHSRRVTSRRARRWAVNYYDRIDYIVITTIWRREGTADVYSSWLSFRRRRLLRLLSRSLLLLSSERRSVEASAFPPFSANSSAIERGRTRGYAMC